MPDNVPWYVHESKWSMFSYIWFENLPITDEELYELIKKEWVLFVPANSFFNWLVNKKDIKHTRECIRISITVTDEEMQEAIEILSKVIKGVYK